ncbi:hypothetical protein ACROYT_G016935 [Oculina patagonica]
MPKKRFPLSKASVEGIQRVIDCVDVREKCKDSSFKDALGRLKGLKEVEIEVVWHRGCYSSFTNQEHIRRLQKRTPDYTEGQSNTSSVSRRSSVSSVDWTKCMFCQTDSLGLNQVQTKETSQKIISKAVFDEVMSCRLAGENDLIAAEGKYHLKCYSKFLRSVEKNPGCKQGEGNDDLKQACFEEVMSFLEKGISQGNIYSLKSVWRYFCCKLQSSCNVDPGIYRSNKLKEKIQISLGDKVSFIQPLNPAEPLLILSSNLGEGALHSILQNSRDNEVEDELNNLSPDAAEDVDLDTELLSWLFRVAVKVHHDIKATPGHNYVGGIDMKNAEKVVPESLYMLIRLLCAGDVTDDGTDEMDVAIKTKILSICQDIIYLVSKGRKLTPKHVGLALTVHQATRSRELVELLHSAGHTVSYDTVLRIDNGIANDVLERYHDNDKVFVPRNFIDCTERCYTRYAVDNIDINEETLSGMGTFHATQFAALRRKNEEEPKVDLKIVPNSSRKLNLEIPSELHELQQVDIRAGKPEPVMNEPVVAEWYEPDKTLIKETFRKKLAWILSRLVKQQSEVQRVPGWTGFNHLLSKNDPQPTIIGPLPILNAAAHEFDTLWTVILKYEALYNKAKMLQWTRTEECKDVVIMLGGFHTQMTFSKVIGKYMESSGLSDIWVESEVFEDSTALNVLKGKVWNRVIRAHKLSYEALWRVLWPLFLAWSQENGKNLDGSLEVLGRKLAEGFSTGTNEERDAAYASLMEALTRIPEVIEEFEAAHADSATFCYWRKYMYMVSILLRFTRALREGDWALYLSSFAEMLPWFAAYDHVNYTRWGAVFLADMSLLPQSAPEVHQGFQNGDFVTKEALSKFNQIPDDQALEHVNRAGKVAGGLVGITRTDTARDRWCLTYNERAQLSEDTKVMFGIFGEEETDHKDCGRARMRRDEEDVPVMSLPRKSSTTFFSHRA